MRFIIHELPYERPIASGELRYFQDARATGAVEKWRVTEAADGYRFIRVDLDARAAASGRSYVYHLTIDETKLPVQLKYRLWDSGVQIRGTALIESDALIVTREINGERFEDVMQMEEPFVFWYPSTVGLGLWAGLPPSQDYFAVMLDAQAEDNKKLMGPIKTKVSLSTRPKEPIDIMKEKRVTQPLLISWSDQQRTLWLDENQWPLKMERQDGLLAIESRYFLYQRITKPGMNQETNGYLDL